MSDRAENWQKDDSIELLRQYEAQLLKLWEGLFEKRGPAQAVARVEYQRAYDAYKRQLDFVNSIGPHERKHGGEKS